jgi:hypothetical protein
VLDGLDEPLHRADGLLLPLLLGQPRVSGEVGERDRHAQAPEIEIGPGEVDLHVPDDVLLDEVVQEAPVDVVHDRRGQRHELPGEALHLLGHLEPGPPVTHHRLVHVEVEQTHLGVGDLGERLPVDPAQLQEGDERQAGGDHRGAVAQELEVVLGDLLERTRVEADGREDPFDERGVETGLLRGLLDRDHGLLARQEVLDVAEGQPALLGRRADLLQRVPAPAQAGDDARVRGFGGGPAGPVGARDELGPDPAAQRRRGHAGPLGHLRGGEGTRHPHASRCG